MEPIDPNLAPPLDRARDLDGDPGLIPDLDDDASLDVELEAYLGDDGLRRPSHVPIRGHVDGEPVPDLSRIPEDGWMDVLRPLRPAARRAAIADAGGHLREAALRVDHRLYLEDLAHQDSVLQRSGPPPAPEPPPRVSRYRNRQVNFRLSHDEYGELRLVAHDYGVTPATLARMFVLSGVRRAQERG